MDKLRIEAKMHELEEKLEYKFNDISLLAEAMKSQKLEKLPTDGKNQKEYSNEALAFLGDTIIKFLIANSLYGDEKNKRKGKMSSEKAELESNCVFHAIMENEKLLLYSYNDTHFHMDNPPKHKKVVTKKHDPYIEAIAASIFMDGGWESVTSWFENWLFPRLKEHNKKP